MRPLFNISLIILLCISHGASAQTKPKRIISLAPHITEMVYAVGAGDRLIAVSDYSDYPLEANQLPKVANFAGIHIEAVLALQPDLVIAWKTGTLAADVERLQQLGIELAYSDPLLLDDIATELAYFGQITGNNEQGIELARQFRQQLEALRREYAEKTKVKVFFAMGTEPVTTVANKAWPQQMLTLCGAENPFAAVKGEYPQVGLEHVLASRPEVIIQASRSETEADFSYWKAFPVIPAVKSGRFVSLNADHIYRTTPRTLLGITQLCKALDRYR